MGGWFNGERPHRGWGLSLMVVRRCPTLPHSLGCSTIGAVGLSFRVRNGTGRFPHAVTAVTLCPWSPGVFVRTLPGGGKFVVTTCVCSCVFQCCAGWFLLLVGNRIVDESSISLHSPWCERLLTPFTGGVCGVSYRLISTGQLHKSLVLASTSGLSTQWSGWGPLTQMCMEISSRSRLPA